MSTRLFYLLVSCVVLTLCAEPDAPCTTPNGKLARCIPIYDCSVIQDAILTLNSSAVEFARNSQCGYADDPLVCCGTTGYPEPSEAATESHLLPAQGKCGVESSQDRVYGGQITEIDEFPWVVLLEYHHKDGASAGYKCGGSLINSRYVLTAAHCIITNDIKLASVRLGEWRISTEDDCNDHTVNRECNDPVIDLRIEKAIPHPEYSRRTGDNDIGLIRLEKNVGITSSVAPICLPTYYAPLRSVGEIMTVAGWGSTENSSQSDYKLKVEVPIIATSTCKAKMGTRGAVTDNQVCAGGLQGKDACQGDSGGPLMGMYENKNTGAKRWYIEGVVAWGVGCARRDFPGIYTRVARYMMWILDNMKEF